MISAATMFHGLSVGKSRGPEKKKYSVSFLRGDAECISAMTPEPSAAPAPPKTSPRVSVSTSTMPRMKPRWAPMARIVPTSGVRWRVAIITELLMMTIATMKMIATARRSTTVARMMNWPRNPAASRQETDSQPQVLAVGERADVARVFWSWRGILEDDGRVEHHPAPDLRWVVDCAGPAPRGGARRRCP